MTSKAQDKFFTQDSCDRCNGSLKDGRIMSMYNTQCICLICKDKETKRPDYAKAVKTDREKIKQGDYNFRGIGYSEDK